MSQTMQSANSVIAKSYFSKVGYGDQWNSKATWQCVFGKLLDQNVVSDKMLFEAYFITIPLLVVLGFFLIQNTLTVNPSIQIFSHLFLKVSS